MARILIAEDEPGIAFALQSDLETEGYEVTAVGDGIALALATARDHPDVTILLMTGYADQRERASGLQALIHDVIRKPFSLNDIRTAVNGAVGAGGATMRRDRLS